MTALVKATLLELGTGEDPAPGAQPVDVQFNPTSLRVQISNKTAGGQQPGSQARQKPGTGEMTVSFELVFDSADEGSTAEPVPVTRKTMIVEKFVRPRGSRANEQTPPRVQFRWGTFQVQGVMESANIDLDLFSANGTPLRAKVAVSIKGQDPQYRYDPVTPSGSNAPAPPGAPPAGLPGVPAAPTPGVPGTPAAPGGLSPTRSAQAMPGESLQALAARNGLDPAAWRALAAAVANPLSLAAGQEIALPDALNGGSPKTGGARGTDAAGVTARLGLDSGAPAAQSAPPATPAQAAERGKALARQGGVAGVLAQQRGAGQQAATSRSRAGFGLPAAAAAGDGAAAPPPAYGAGVPLRERIGGDEPPRFTPDPTVPGWQALPVREAGTLKRLGSRNPDRCACKCAGGRNTRKV